MLPPVDIQRYGGKAAILNFVREKVPTMPIPFYVVKEHSQEMGTLLSTFEQMKKPVIVRSSSPHEYGDFEGVFESVKGVRNEFDLLAAVDRVKRSALSEKAMLYAHQNGFPIDERMHVIVQEQAGSYYDGGAMMRHPNNPDLFIICYSTPTRSGARMHYGTVIDYNNGKRVRNKVLFSSGMEEGNAKFLLEVYKQLEALEEIAVGQSLFVEFGFDPFFLYQVRPFKKIETADFKVEAPNGASKTDLAFGITSPDGIVLPLIKGVGTFEASMWINQINLDGVHDDDLRRRLNQMGTMASSLGTSGYRNAIASTLRLHNATLDQKLDAPYCYIASSANREDYPVDLSIPGMQALIVGDMRLFMVHDMMRLIKRAKVTAGFDDLAPTELYQNARSLEDRVRIISNGKEAVVLKE